MIHANETTYIKQGDKYDSVDVYVYIYINIYKI